MSENDKTARVEQRSSAIYKRLLLWVRPYIGLFLLSVIGNLIYALCQPGLAETMGYFLKALDGGPEKYVLLVPIAGFLLIFTRGIGYFIGKFYIGVVAQNVVRDLRRELFERLMHLPNAFYDKQSSGHLVSKIAYDASQVTFALTNAITVVVREGLTVIVLLSYMIYKNWHLTLLFFVIGPILAAAVSWIGKRMRRLSTRIQNSMGDITQSSSEVIQGYQTLRTHGAEPQETKRFGDINENNRRQQIKFEMTQALTSPVMQTIVALALGLVMYLVLNVRDSHPPDVLIAYITAAALLPKSLRALGGVYGQIQKGVAAGESIFNLLDESTERNSGIHAPETIDGSISIANLSFSYPEKEAEVLTDINLDIAPGQTVALVGKSGSGKTTLAGLLLRFYDYRKGSIDLDGVPIRDYSLASLRRQMALVPQHVTLFNATIAENIAYGDTEGAPLEDIKAAAKDAYADVFIDRLEHGYDTLLGENALTLSGGQRQRLAIARAILRNSPVLILDEATSALDNESEQYIQSALEKVMADTTTIVIAHRLSTIEKADLIVVMDQGRIVEQGDHKSLLAKDGHYARLHDRDFED